MDIAQKFLAFIVVLGVLVIFHELGHFVVARWFGVKVLRFSVGFGRVIWARPFGRDATEWALSAIPLGGYVKMCDEREGPVAPADLGRAFNRQSVWKRIAIVAAGPIANLLLAVVLFAGTFVAGIPGQRAILAAPAAGTPAATAGVREGDLVQAADGTPVGSWQDLRWRMLRASGGSAVALEVERPDGARAIRVISIEGLTGTDWEAQFHAAARPQGGLRSAGGRRSRCRQAGATCGNPARRPDPRDRRCRGRIAGGRRGGDERAPRRSDHGGDHARRASGRDDADARRGRPGRAQDRNRRAQTQDRSGRRRATRRDRALRRRRSARAGRAQDVGTLGVHAEDARAAS